MNGEVFAQFRGQIFVDVLGVLLRQNHFEDAGATCGKHLLLDAADWEDATRKGNLTGHGDVAPDGPAGQH
jgi:hypothetical protein